MDAQLQLIYPISRLLSNPRIFYAIADYLGGPDPDTLKDAFYDLLEHNFADQENPEDCVFDAEEICFKISDDGVDCQMILDNGIAYLLQAIEGEIRAQITNDTEMAATTAIYKRIVTAIEEAHPDLAGNIVLCSPPTPGNQYLRSDDGDRFEGSFHLLSDPERTYAFHIEVIDVRNDQLKATIQPIDNE